MARPRGTPNIGTSPFFTGRRLRKEGYVDLWKPEHPLARKDGYVFEHRYVLYEAGVEIPAGYSVHHRNHNKADNRIENLEVMPKGQHHSHHVQAAGKIINQYGEHALTGLDRLGQVSRWAAANPEKVREYKRRYAEKRRV